MTWNDEPLPPHGDTPEEDDVILQAYPYVERPIYMHYGFNIHTGSNVYLGFNCIILDSGTVSIGSRTRIGPNACLFGSTHPLDPDVRNGAKGPEIAGNLKIGKDCLIGDYVTILSNVTIGDGCTIAAASVVTMVGVRHEPKEFRLTTVLFCAGYSPISFCMRQSSQGCAEDRLRQYTGICDYCLVYEDLSQL